MNLDEPFLTDPKQIKAWLDSIGVRGWRINGAGLVDVEGSVSLGGKLGLLTKLPIRFGKVSGNFYCDNNQLVSLEGSPTVVSGDFWCIKNRIVSLKGAPKKVGEDFDCSKNRIISLEGVPKKIGGDFYCSYNQLASLKGAPEQLGGDFSCSYNQLVSLEGLPEKAGVDLWCDHNLLVDFKGLERVSIEGNLVVTNPTISGQDNVFVSLEGLPKELYSKVVGLDIPAMLELRRKRAAGLLGDEVEELISEVELG